MASVSGPTVSKRLQLFILLVTLVAAILFAATRPRGHHSLMVKAYFQNAQGLRSNAPVQLAGVDIGRVSSVRARPEMRERPAEVIMIVQTPYSLSIPNDAVAYLSQGGLPGGTVVEIDIRKAYGPPLKNWGVLTTVEDTKFPEAKAR
ncbi:MAG TPA: MCE family protein [Candidatus Angelobacter sp.]|nr:MCE family protein [Candidatus Angelobacter sp.]